jgi:hypothetical protein
MKKQQHDDWGTPLGGDPDRPKEQPSPKKKPAKDSLAGLVYYFSNAMPLETMARIGAPVNGPALMKGFKKLVEAGFTHNDIRGMIDTFASKLRAKPLKPELLAWRVFLGDLDSLAHSFRTSNPNEDYGKWGLDPRLMED